MKLTLSCLCMLCCASVFAQQKAGYTIQKDTINLRGIVYEATGNPAPGIFVISKQKELHFDRYAVSAKTDSTGYFELKGAMPEDTLIIRSINSSLTYMNKGSRYMVIYLPPEKTTELNSRYPIEVIAQRKYPKVIPTFKIAANDEVSKIIDVWEHEPAFPGGIYKFYAYVQKLLVYPEKAIEHNVEGTVQIAFIVNRDGSLSGFKIMKGIGYECDEEAMEIIKKSPKWKPGISDGRSVSARFSISIEFKLSD